MVRGCEKRVVWLQHPNSRYFEEVCFILRDTKEAPVKRRDLVEEANRILCENGWEGITKGTEKKRGMLPFLLGFVSALCLFLPLLFLL